jgi:hypothetical protein
MYTESHIILGKTINFYYDNNYEFFWILVNWEYSKELEKRILDKFSPIDVELYDNWWLNMNLHDIITNYLEYA